MSVPPASRPGPGWCCAALAAALAITGCSTVRTTEVGVTGSPPPRGQSLVPYSLPQALLSAELYAIGDGYEIVVSQPVMEPDARYRLFLSAQMSPLAHDRFDVKVDPLSGLLTNVEVKVQDKSGDILVALSEAAGAMGQPIGVRGRRISPSGPGAPLIAQTIFDPLSQASVEAANLELRDGVRRWSEYRGRPFEDPGPLLEVEGLASADGPAALEAFPTAAQVAAACRDAVCAPTYTPVRIRARAPNGPAVEDIARLPDARRLARIDFRRTMFVTRETKATFRSGMVAAIIVDKPSEGLAIAMLPVQIIKASLTAATDVVQLRINLGAKEREYERARAEAAAEAAQAATRAGARSEATAGNDNLLVSRSFGAATVSGRVGER